MKKRVFAMLLAVLVFVSVMPDADAWLSLRASFALAQEAAEPHVDGDEVNAGAAIDEPAEADMQKQAEGEETPEADAREEEEVTSAPEDRWTGYAEIASGATIRLSGGETAKTRESGIVLAKGSNNGSVTITYVCMVSGEQKICTGKVAQSALTMKPADWTQAGDVQVGEYALKAIDVETTSDSKEEQDEAEAEKEETEAADSEVSLLQLVRLPDGMVVAFDDLAEAEREELLSVFEIESNEELDDEALRAEILDRYAVRIDPAEGESVEVLMPDGSCVALDALLQMNREELLTAFGDAAEEVAELSAAQLAAYILSAQAVSTTEIDANQAKGTSVSVPSDVTPKPVGGIRYTNTWWDNHTADDRKNVEATVTFEIPLTEAKADGKYTEPDYIIDGGYVYKVISGDDVTYELVYDPDKVTYVNTFNPADFDADTYYVEVGGQVGGGFPDGARNIDVKWGGVDGYQLREDEGNKTVTYVKLKTIEIEKHWLDSGLSGTESIRPSVEDWLGYLGNTLLGSDGSKITLDKSMVTKDGDNWKLVLENVPAFVDTDIPVIYRVEESFDPALTYPNGAVNNRGYETTEYNSGADQQGGANHETYEGGYSESVLKGIVSFEFKKVWLDGDENVNQRPAVTFYLYRYVPDSKDSDINNASPVRGHDQIAYKEGAADFQKKYQTEPPTNIVYASDLEEFDKDGKKYNYFIMERIAAGKYSYESTDAQGNPINYLDINGVAYVGSNHDEVSTGNTTIYNRRVGTYQPIAQKTWASVAVQAMSGTVTLALQSRLKNKSGSTWDYVCDEDGNIVTKTQDGFNAEHREMEITFDSPVSRYDENGYELEFRIVEIDASVSPNTASVAANANGVSGLKQAAYYQEGDHFLSNDYRFEVHYDGDHITNRLVGKTDFLVRKTFSPGDKDAQSASFYVRVERDEPFATDEVLPTDAVLDGANAFILKIEGRPSYDETTKKSTLNYDIEGLNRYDANGREYTYTLTEMGGQQYKAYLGNTQYGFDSMSINVSEKDDPDWGKRKQITGGLNNGLEGEGESLIFHVSKEWLDEGDLLHRKPVQWALYYKGTKVWPTQGYGELTAQNDWHDEFRLPIYTEGLSQAEADELRDYANYTVREISVDGNAVLPGDLETYYSLGKGDCALTSDHVYKVIDNQPAKKVTLHGETYGDCYLQNIRVGELTIEVTKEWNLGGITEIDGKKIEAQFKITNDSNSDVITFALTPNNSRYLSPSLQKFDAQGCVITYTVEEISLNGQAFVDGAADFGDYQIISAKTGESETIGDRHTHDEQKRSFSNTREKYGTVTINKVWHDDGSAGRPDIALTLWRKDTETGKMVEVKIDKIWDTKHNEWYWSCAFGSQPLYNANGYPYEYYVTEVIPQVSLYTGKQQYYNGTDQPKASGTDAETTFKPIDGTDTMAKAAALDPVTNQYIGKKEPGTVINTRELYLRIDAYKHWQGKPNWIKDSELPEIVVQLQMTMDAAQGEAGYVPYKLSSNPYNTNNNMARKLNAKNQFKFTETKVPYYDAYGRAYDNYRLIEISDNPAYYTTLGTGGNYDITNQYTGDPKIRIGVNKVWDWNALQRAVNGDKYPKLKFELWQSFGAQGFSSKKEDTLIGTAEIDADDVEAAKTKSMTVYFKNKEDGTEFFPTYLWLFKNGANQQVYYTYWIKEFDENGKQLNAYEVSFTPNGTTGTAGVSGKHLITEADVTGKEYIFGAKNTYKTWNRDIVATKKWLDDSDAYGTRPSDAVPLNYRLWRTTDSSKTKPASEADVDLTCCEEVTGAAVNWEQKADTWTCTFSAQGSETLPEYNTKNQKYYYFVTEKLNSPYDVIYKQQARTDALSITNELNPVELYAKKLWQFEQNGKTITPNTTQRTDVVFFSGFDTSGKTKMKLTYRVTAKDGQGNAINLFDQGSTNTKEESVDFDNTALNGSGYRLLSKLRLPQYVYIKGEAVEVLYTIEEVMIGNTPVVGGQAGCITVANAKTAQKNHTFTGEATNSLEVMQIKLEKKWEDAYNREGKRPGTVTYTLAANNKKSKDKSITNNTSGTVAKEPAHTASYLVPKFDMEGTVLTYTFTEKPVSMYTTEVKITGESDYASGSVSGTLTKDGDTASFLNSYKPHKLKIKAAKVWEPDNYAYWEILMPDEIKVKLQRKTDEAASEWEDVPDTVTLRKAEDWAWPTNIQPWLVDCFREKKSDNIADSFMYSYRVVEVLGNDTIATGETGHGLTLSVEGESESLITGAIDGKKWTEENDYYVREAANGGFTLTNTANEKSLNIEKTWVDAKRPKDDPALKLDFKVYYYRTSEASSPEDALKNKKANELTQDAFTLPENGKWTKTIEHLPTHDKEGYALTYFAREQYPYYTVKVGSVETKVDASSLYIASVDDSTPDVTKAKNTRKTVNLTVNKKWDDDENKFNTRKTLMFTLYSSKDASKWSECESKTLTLTATDTKVSFTGLPALYIGADGETYAYYYKVVETPQSGKLDNYTTTVAFAPASAGAVTSNADAYAYVRGDAGQTAQDAALGTATFTNTLKNVTKNLVKDWADQDSSYGTRPTTVTFTAKRHTGECDTGDLCTLGDDVPLSDGTKLTVELEKSKDWQASVENLPKYDADGEEYVYHFIEDLLGYKQSDTIADDTISDDDIDEDEIGITNTECTTNVKVTKEWSPDDDPYGVRPAIWVQLQWKAEGEADYSYIPSLAPVELNADNGWSYTFKNLPIAKAGIQLSYRVKERGIKNGTSYALPDGYTAANDGISNEITAEETTGTQDVTLSNTLETTNVKVTKEWSPDADPYGVRPNEIWVKLQWKADGEKDYSDVPSIDPAELNAGNSWSYTFNDLPIAKAGKQLKYRVYELGLKNGNAYARPLGYTAKDDGISNEITAEETTGTQDVTLKNTLETTNVKVTKEWSPDDDPYGVRPDEIWVQLQWKADGEAVYVNVPTFTKVKLDAGNSWSYTFSDLPIAKAGKQLSYRVKELGLKDAATDTYALPLGYTAANQGVTDAISAEKTTGTQDVTLSNTLETTNVKVTKEWSPDDDPYGARPDEIWVQLEWSTEENGPFTAVPTVGPKKLDGNWEATFEDLPIAKAGEQLYYQVKELGLKNGNAYALPLGYTAKDDGISKVITAEKTTGTQDVTIKNTLETTNVKVTKEWSPDDDPYGVRPDEIWVQLQWKADGEKDYSDVPSLDPVELYAGNSWSYTFSDLPIAKAGKQLNYRVKELGLKDSADDTYALPPGYTAKDDGISNEITAEETTDTQDVTLKNTLETTNVKVKKEWSPDADPYGVRPDEIWVQLEWSTEENGPFTAVPTVGPKKLDGNWEATFEDLPIAKAGEQLYYQVKELGLKNGNAYALPLGYTAKDDGISKVITAEKTTGTQDVTLKNTLETTNVKVTKEWSPDDDPYAVRPDEIWVKLQWKADGEAVYVDVPTLTEVKLNAGNSWSYTFSDLPIAKAGKQLSYQVVELGVPNGNVYVKPEGYTAENGGISNEITAEETQGTQDAKLTNTLKTMALSVEKTWVDASNRYATRPNATEFELEQTIDGRKWTPTLANGRAVILTLNGDIKAATWSKTFEGYPEKDKDGNPITYRVVERVPYGYAGAPAGATSWVNTLMTSDLALTKVWEDQQDAYGTRPQSVKVHLEQYKDNEWIDVGESRTLTQADNWEVTFEGIPLIDLDGKVILYRVVEDLPTGYTCDPAEFDKGAAELTNNLITTQLTVTKSWQDNNNEKGIRPSSITATLQKQKNGIWVDVLKNGAPVEITISRKDKWTATIDDLPKLDPDDGTEVQYRIVEKVPKGYKSSRAVAFVDGVAKLRNEIIEEPENVIVDYFERYGSPLAGFGQLQNNVGDCFD